MIWKKSDNSHINPAIIVSCYNRPESLRRLLGSLGQALYPEDNNVQLVVSIDKCDNVNTTQQIERVIEDFRWKYGDKIVIKHNRKLGLKNHIYSCADLSDKYGAIVLLEDDLVVSRWFYRYSQKAISFFKDETMIAGVSLYKHLMNPYHHKPFFPLDDNCDNYFVKYPSSWGQIWTKNQWEDFILWRENTHDNSKEYDIPKQVEEWPESSWLKIFVKYMVESNKYFVYPSLSLTTNFGDVGTHFKEKDKGYQVPLQFSEKEFIFKKLNNAISVYDTFFELSAKSLIKVNDQFELYDICIDTYGEKDIHKISQKYILTSKLCSRYICEYGDDMLPLINNVIYKINGKGIVLTEVQELRSGLNNNPDDVSNIRPIHKYINDFRYIVSRILLYLYKNVKPD